VEYGSKLTTDIVPRPTVCPYCKGKAVHTLAKVFTKKTMWTCRKCDRTWTIAGLGPPAR
jgi:transposase-like protein